MDSPVDASAAVDPSVAILKATGIAAEVRVAVVPGTALVQETVVT
jgi:hypothetical protein